MVVYIKDTNGEYKTLKEIAAKYNVPMTLIKGRHGRGLRDIKDLTQAKYEMVRK